MQMLFYLQVGVSYNLFFSPDDVDKINKLLSEAADTHIWPLLSTFYSNCSNIEWLSVR